jgi:hypothetical protein
MSNISVIIPISPIPSHPDTKILEETLDSIRYHLPDAELLVTFDGVRLEQTKRRADYERHIYDALWLLDHRYGNTAPFIFEKHMHQSGMMRATIDEIRTPLMLYVEQDTPLTEDHIDWPTISRFILDGHSDLVRFSHEATILADHSHLMHNAQTPLFMRTSQWSQRPHLASTAYYRRIMNAHFTDRSRCFIEDLMYGVTVNGYLKDGPPGWMQNRLHIYTPGDNIKRSYHTDGRAGEQKFDDRQVW